MRGKSTPAMLKLMLGRLGRVVILMIVIVILKIVIIINVNMILIGMLGRDCYDHHIDIGSN